MVENSERFWLVATQDGVKGWKTRASSLEHLVAFKKNFDTLADWLDARPEYGLIISSDRGKSRK